MKPTPDDRNSEVRELIWGWIPRHQRRHRIIDDGEDDEADDDDDDDEPIRTSQRTCHFSPDGIYYG